MSSPTRIAGVQMDIEIGQPRTNLTKILSALEETNGEGAKLTIFPECALPGYCFDSREEAMPYAEPIPGPSCDELAKACSRLESFALIYSPAGGPARLT